MAEEMSAPDKALAARSDCGYRARKIPLSPPLAKGKARPERSGAKAKEALSKGAPAQGNFEGRIGCLQGSDANRNTPDDCSWLVYPVQWRRFSDAASASSHGKE